MLNIRNTERTYVPTTGLYIPRAENKLIRTPSNTIYGVRSTILNFIRTEYVHTVLRVRTSGIQ